MTYEDPTDSEGIVLLAVSFEDYDFIVKFDPDRERTASRQDMVDVLHTIQRIIAEGLVT